MFSQKKKKNSVLSHLHICVGYDMSTFIRRYARYLNEKAFAYRQMAFDFTRVKKGYVEAKPQTGGCHLHNR